MYKPVSYKPDKLLILTDWFSIFNTIKYGKEAEEGRRREERGGEGEGGERDT